MRRHSTGRSDRRSSFLGHPGRPFSGFTRLELLGAVALVVALRLAGVELTRDDGVSLGFVQAIIAGVAAAFGWLADKAVTVAVVVWHATKIVGLAIVRFATGVGGIFGKVYGLLGDFWRGVLRPFVNFVWRSIDRLHAWLKNTLGPALKFVENLRRRLLEFYDRWFRPIFDTIELVRRTLQLLSVFRIEWARELDRKLAELEDRLLWPLREALFRLNQIADWLNRVIGLDGLFQRATLLRSLWRDIRDVNNMWRNAFSRPLSPAEKRAAGERVARAEPAQTGDEIGAYFRGREPERAKVIDELAAQFRLTLRGGTRL